jgi:hypothetical protein
MVPVYGTMYWRLQFCAEKDLLDYAKVQDSKNDGQLMMKSNTGTGTTGGTGYVHTQVQ